MINYKLLLPLLGLLTITGCIDKPSTSPSTAEEDRVQNLVVSSDFDWSTTQDVACSITAPHLAQLSISTTPTDEPFAVFFAGGAVGSEAVTLNVPTASDHLYVSYMTTSGAQTAPKAVSLANGKLSYAVGNDSRPFDDLDGERKDGVVYIPSLNDGWGTMLFEDQWPGYGDYDFNDLVFNYKAQLYISHNNTVKTIVLGVRVKAVSGSMPYQLYLQMLGLRSTDIAEISTISSKNTRKGDAILTQVNAEDGMKDRPVFRFDNIRDNATQLPGSIWTNTEMGYELSDDQLVEATFEITLSRPVPLSEVNFMGMDFFLARTDKGGFGPEIHRCNYEPINLDLYNELLKSDGRNETYYKSEQNLIWAVNVPGDIAHTYEKTDFLMAYPEFKTWAETSGRESKEWYKKGENKHLVRKK